MFLQEQESKFESPESGVRYESIAKASLSVTEEE